LVAHLRHHASVLVPTVCSARFGVLFLSFFFLPRYDMSAIALRSIGGTVKGFRRQVGNEFARLPARTRL